MEKSSILKRVALGNVASLGQLYDARTDNFCGISIFKKDVPQSAVLITDNHFSDIHLVHTDEFSEKFSKLDVKAELQVSLLAGLFTLEGSGRYLSDQKTSTRTVRSSLLYNIKTKEENVNIYHESLRDAFSLDAIGNGLATHVVVGISWGANSVLTCEYQNRNNRDVKEIQGSLSASLKKLSLSISGNASVEFNEGDMYECTRFDIKVFGDILPRDEDLPTTFEGALNFMKKMPSLVATSNQGRGKPLTYQLIPISLLQDYLQFTIKGVMVLKTLEEDCLIRIVQLFEQLSKVYQKINDFHNDALEYRYCVTPSDMSRISNMKQAFTIEEAKLRSKLAKTLKLVRSGHADVSDLENIIAECLNNEFLTGNIFVSWGLVMEKIKFAREMIWRLGNPDRV